MTPEGTNAQPAEYRYLLTRDLRSLLTLEAPRRVLICMLNPSTATAQTDDPTIRRAIRFAAREDATELAIVNLFAARATDPRKLRAFDDPVGPDNDAVIEQQAAYADLIIAAWGVLPAKAPKRRAQEILDMLTRHGDVHRLGEPTAAGNPRHPLYLPANAARILHAARRR